MRRMLRVLLLAYIIPSLPCFTILTQPTKRIPASHGSTSSSALRQSALSSLEVESAMSKEQADEQDATSTDFYEALTKDGIHPVPEKLVTLPRHSHAGVNQILVHAENALRVLHFDESATAKVNNQEVEESSPSEDSSFDRVYANSYVDLGKVDVVGLDYDYTLVTYTEELLELIYGMALKRLVMDRQYPMEMLDANLKFDPMFSIRGLAVDKETGWICHLSYTHKVAVAWEGREKVKTSRIFVEYSGKRAMRPSERRQRIKPLNDLFSMAECCLIADTVQFFKDRDIPFCPRNVVQDILEIIGQTHMSGDFHKLVATNPRRYFKPTPHLKDVLEKLRSAGKKLIVVSNSPFWYVDAGMKYVIGEDWIDGWDAVITTAGKPHFYTNDQRPFREVCRLTGRTKFNEVVRFEKGAVYREGCLKELTRLMDWKLPPRTNGVDDDEAVEDFSNGGNVLATSNVLYIGDSLFADLVDAKREFGWTTAAVTPEVEYEAERQNEKSFTLVQQSLRLLLDVLRLMQEELGQSERTTEDLETLDRLENLVSAWRDRETMMLGNPFGSVFRARYQPSLFAHSLRRYCDLYMGSVSSLRKYSPQHRFYPRDTRLLSHEIASRAGLFGLDEVLGRDTPPTTESDDATSEQKHH